MASIELIVIVLCKLLRIQPLTQEDIMAERESVNQKQNQDYYMVKFNRDDFYDEI